MVSTNRRRGEGTGGLGGEGAGVLNLLIFCVRLCRNGGFISSRMSDVGEIQTVRANEGRVCVRTCSGSRS